MITLHRLGHFEESFELNPDLIVTVESTPDTVITLATSAKVVVSDSPEEIAEAVRQWRAKVLIAALHDDQAQGGTAVPLAAAGAGAGRFGLASGRSSSL